MNITGVVKVRVTVAANGTVKDATLVGGHPVLAAAALDAAKKWRFESRPEESTGIVEFRFDPPVGRQRTVQALAEEGCNMNIGKKLYLSFGVILATVLVLLAINLYAVHREHETKAAAQRSIDMTEATSLVRFQMMQNRLHLQNYLLSGDTRDVEKMNDGERQLSDALHHAQELANSAQQRSSLEKVQGLEQAWSTDFASPLVDKRRAVDSGNATVAELQIFYLQKDPNSWVSRSSDVLDEVDQENRKLLDERRRSDESAATWTILAAVFSSLIALALGVSHCLPDRQLGLRDR